MKPQVSVWGDRRAAGDYLAEWGAAFRTATS
jgi:hypothetical protein